MSRLSGELRAGNQEYMISSITPLQGKRQADSIPHFLNPHKHIPQAPMMREQLNLARTIKKHIILYQLAPQLVSLPPLPSRKNLPSPSPLMGKLTSQPLQPLPQPLPIPLQFLNRIHHPSIWPQRLFLHDILQPDQIADVKRDGNAGGGRVDGVCGIEIHNRGFAPDGAKELMHSVAVGCFPRSGGADYYLGEGHGGGGGGWWFSYFFGNNFCGG